MMTCAVEAYARSVVEGRAVAGRLVRLACARHLRDLVLGPARGLVWDAAAAGRALHFFGFLQLIDATGGGMPFVLSPFQAFIVGSLFGWKGADGYRRFRTAYVESGKGSGKSPLAGAIGLYCLMADGEGGAEVYSAATTREQAGILFRDAKAMAEMSPGFRTKLIIGETNLAHPASRSYFRPVSSEGRGLDGKRVHCALIDELHEHPSAVVADKMRAGTKGRRQALVFEITNSGYDRNTVCWAHREYSVRVLEGVLDNDSWFAYVCTLDCCAQHRSEGKLFPVDGCPECDDWRDEAVWPKANPNLGVSIPLKYLREQVAEAVGMPTKQGVVKRLNLCIWTEGLSQLIPAELWASCGAPVDAAAFAIRSSFGGMDLAARYDVAAFVLASEDAEGFVDLLPYFWIPESVADAREKSDRVPWRLWAQQGYVTLTGGDWTDYSLIQAKVIELAGAHQLGKVNYDPTDASAVAQALVAAGVEMVDFRQNMTNFNEPTEHLLLKLKQGTLRHGNHPVLAWMAANVKGQTDAAGHIRPVKPDRGDHQKIDGIVAAIMALAGVLFDAPSADFEIRGV